MQIGLVFAEAINHLTEEKEEERHGGAMDDGTEAAGDHEEVIVLVGEGEELVEREALLLFLLRLGRHCFCLCLYCCIRH